MREEESRSLAAVSAGSPVGDLLRRYWMPVAGECELEERAILPVRLLGEDLVLYRDHSGTLGLVGRWCPHRRSDLAFGCVEEHGIRCSYHGWRFSETGQCLEQPFEDTVSPSSSPGDRIRITHYPVRSTAGLVWAYIGPEPIPLIPDWAGFHSTGFTVVALLHVPCNWVQIMESFYDPVHVEWLHDRWSYKLHGRNVPKQRPRHTAYRWLDFDYGVVFQRKLDGADEWLADRTVIFPNVDGAGGQGWYLTWIVPEDDTHSLLVFRLTITSWKTPLGQVMVPPKNIPAQPGVPAYRTRAAFDQEYGPTADVKSYLVSQDTTAWLGLGPLVDRTRERLGQSDQGVIMFRKKLLDQARLVAEGGDPQGVIRDPMRNRRITLPGARKSYGRRGEGLPGLAGDEDVMFRAFLPFGMPQEIKDSIESTMSSLVDGLRPDWWKN